MHCARLWSNRDTTMTRPVTTAAGEAPGSLVRAGGYSEGGRFCVQHGGCVHQHGIGRGRSGAGRSRPRDAGPGDGGFVCVPGTHKTNLSSATPADVTTYERPAHYVRQPPVKAGDVLIFTEALIHGTWPWNADDERRALIYKYSPGHSSWSSTHYDPSHYPGASQQQIRIMVPPSVGDRPDSVL